MLDMNGCFYLCGPAGNMPAQMKEAVIQAFVDARGMPKPEAEKLVTDMQV